MTTKEISHLRTFNDYKGKSYNLKYLCYYLETETKITPISGVII